MSRILILTLIFNRHVPIYTALSCLAHSEDVMCFLRGMDKAIELS
jgi:hypothetical protein